MRSPREITKQARSGKELIMTKLYTCRKSCTHDIYRPRGIEICSLLLASRFTHVVLDKVRVRTSWTGSADVTVLFLVTLEGSIHKMVVLPSHATDDGASSVCLVEMIHFSDRPTPRLIHSIQLLEGRKVSCDRIVKYYIRLLCIVLILSSNCMRQVSAVLPDGSG